MILQELVKFFERKLEEGEISTIGFEKREIPYLIEIDREGNFIRFIATLDSEGKGRASVFSVPKAVVRSKGINANLLWDNFEYIFGVENRDKRTDFIRKIRNLKEISNDESLGSLLAFYTKFNLETLKKDKCWDEIEESKPNLTFKLLADSHIICMNKRIVRYVSQIALDNSDAQKDICLVTGKNSTIERVHSKIRGLYGANPSGANLVSFNLTSFESYGWVQGLNAPTGKYANIAYGTSMNVLLSKDSFQKITFGETTVVFWSEGKNECENKFSLLLKSPQEQQEANAFIRIHKTLDNSFSEQYSFFQRLNQLAKDKTKFYILGVSPNVSRICIRFWCHSAVGEIAKNLQRHIADSELETPNAKYKFISVNQILCSVASQGKVGNINPSLVIKLIESIVNGTEYPILLFSSILNRLKAERDISFVRVAIIKAILNRKGRAENFNNYKELRISMDESNLNVAYRLGRLFAVIERHQEQASLKRNVTIKNRYFAAALSRPATIFPILFNLSIHYASTIEDRWYESLKAEILAPLSEKIPINLSLEDQGIFVIGYYHQRNELIKNKNKISREAMYEQTNSESL